MTSKLNNAHLCQALARVLSSIVALRNAARTRLNDRSSMAPSPPPPAPSPPLNHSPIRKWHLAWTVASPWPDAMNACRPTSAVSRRPTAHKCFSHASATRGSAAPRTLCRPRPAAAAAAVNAPAAPRAPGSASAPAPAAAGSQPKRCDSARSERLNRPLFRQMEAKRIQTSGTSRGWNTMLWMASEPCHTSTSICIPCNLSAHISFKWARSSSTPSPPPSGTQPSPLSARSPGPAVAIADTAAAACRNKMTSSNCAMCCALTMAP
mmetsp:Transcript_58429/g.153921  ORF Transcript_58429/g.153921 Transcript_58429/m.153921 type:complete len:265 (+) Transcript_58429:2604-3398(+)